MRRVIWSGVVGRGRVAKAGGLFGQYTLRNDTSSPFLLSLSLLVKTANPINQSKGKEWWRAVSRLAKDVDKSFGAPPPPPFPSAPFSLFPSSALHPSLTCLFPSSSCSPSDAPLTTAPFSSSTSLSALHTEIASHLALARLDAVSALCSFLAESGMPAPPGLEEGGEVLAQLRELHGIAEELRAGSVDRAIAWLEEHPEVDKDGALEYGLRKEQFIGMIFSALGSGTKGSVEGSTPDVAMDTDDTSSAPPVASAIACGGHPFRRLMTSQRSEEICALLTTPLYLPFPRLLASPYGSLFSAYSSTSSSFHSTPNSTSAALHPPLDVVRPRLARFITFFSLSSSTTDPACLERSGLLKAGRYLSRRGSCMV